MRPNLIRGLVVFCAAARYLSFKMAADDLCITPSAVSHQIKALEDQIGAGLFERRTRAIVLTPLGAALYSQSGPLLRSLDAVTTSFLTKAHQRRELRIALPSFFASELFIPRLTQFTRTHPELDIRVDTTEGKEDDLPGQGDAAVLLLANEPKGYCVYPLFELRLVVACSPGLAAEFSLTEVDALRNCTLIIHKSRPEVWSDWFAAAGSRQSPQSPIIELDNMFAVARAAERGLGVALVPVPLADAWLRSRALVTPFDTVLDTGERYFFVHRLEDAEDTDLVTLAEWTTRICSKGE
ncbi:MAG: LysR family transcriptional regulator [Gammaproteobacteria bacterium]|nr:LysR family transcriptional regulator [Gammaproteobacteria bacterium]